MFTRILVPLDGSDDAARAIPVAAELARRFGSTLILLEVVTLGPERHLYAGETGRPLDHDLADAEEHAAEAAHRHLARIAASLVPIPTEVEVRIGRPSLVIGESATENRCGLICMTAHGQGRRMLRQRHAEPRYQGHPVHWMLGGIADRVVHTSPVPVLIVRPDQSQPPEGA